MSSTQPPIDNAALGTHWRDATFVALDLEGTGPQEGADEGIVEIAVVAIERANLGTGRYSSLVNPLRAIPRLTSRIHGIRDADVVNAPTIEQIAPTLHGWLDRQPMVAHNARIDWGLLKRRCPNLAPLCVIDTMKLFRAWYPEVATRSLSHLIEHFDIRDAVDSAGTQKHRAGRDALAVAHIFLRMLYERAPEPGTIATLIEIGGVGTSTLEQHPRLF